MVLDTAAQQVEFGYLYQPNSVTDSNRGEILDPEGVVHRAQAEGLGLCPCLKNSL